MRLTKLPSLGAAIVTMSPRLVREALARRVAILDRREHRAKEQHGPIGIAVMRVDHLRHQIGGIATDLAIDDAPSSPKPSLPSTVSDTVVCRTSSSANRVEQARNGPIAQDALLSFALPSSRAERPSTSRRLTSLPSVAADDPTGRRRHQHDLGLRVVPRGVRMDAGIHPGADCGHRLRLGEDLGVRADAHFQILAPRALRDQHLLQMRASGDPGLRRARSSPTRRLTSARIAAAAAHVAARAFLDHALQHGEREGDAGGLDGLQVDRCEQPRLAAVALFGRRVGQYGLERAERSPAAPRSAAAGSALRTGRAWWGTLPTYRPVRRSRTATTEGPATPAARPARPARPAAASSGSTGCNASRNAAMRVLPKPDAAP